MRSLHLFHLYYQLKTLVREGSVTALYQSGSRVTGEGCSVQGIALQNFSCFIHCFIKKAYQTCDEYFQLDGRSVQIPGPAQKDKIPAALPQLQRQARKSHLKEEESIFHAKPVRAGQNRRSNRNARHWPDQGKGHCCKRRGRLASL